MKSMTLRGKTHYTSTLESIFILLYPPHFSLRLLITGYNNTVMSCDHISNDLVFFAKHVITCISSKVSYNAFLDKQTA